MPVFNVSFVIYAMRVCVCAQLLYSKPEANFFILLFALLRTDDDACAVHTHWYLFYCTRFVFIANDYYDSIVSEKKRNKNREVVAEQGWKTETVVYILDRPIVYFTQ